VAALLLAALGCGDDDNGPIPVEPPTIDVRNGTWEIVRAYSASGSGTCDPLPPDTTEVVLCAFDPAAGGSSISMTCDLEQEGEAIFLECSGRLDLFPCRLEYAFVGQGTITDTTYSIDVVRTMKVVAVEDDDGVCVEYEDPCTTRVVSTARWISAKGDSLCTGDTEASAPAVSLFRTLFERVPPGR
jgi:hypothetical protein